MSTKTTYSRFIRANDDGREVMINTDHIEFFEYKQRDGSSYYDLSFHMRSGADINLYASQDYLTFLIDAVARAGYTEER